MPAPQASLFSKLTKLFFAVKMIKLPTDWQDLGEQFPDAFQENEKQAPPNSPLDLLPEPTLNKYHVDTASGIGKKFEAYIDGVCGAVCDGIDKWMKTSAMTGVLIMGPVGILMPGGGQGAPLTPLILASAPKKTPQETKYSNAIAGAFGNLWQLWHTGLSGVLTYPPTFAVCPSPVHPPTPNIPMPLITLASPGEAGLSPTSLKGMMTANLGDPTALHATDLFDSIAQAFSIVFRMFKASTMVRNVLGTGPVPTYAPPFVPVGPVLGGVGNGPPGCLM